MGESDEKRYTDEGLLIVSELERCEFFEKDASAPKACSCDCFYCKFSNFRSREYIEQVQNEEQNGVLFGVCHNENNKK